MNRTFAILILCCLAALTAGAQLKSPDDFLGYKLGSRFTPHWKVVSYFKHVRDNANDRVRLQDYGYTNEGRELMLAFISNPEHIRNLEQIRLNNLRLANIARDRVAALE